MHTYVGVENVQTNERFAEKPRYYLAQRVRKHFAALLTPKYKATLYKFQQTQISRTGQSAAAFTYGLFEGTGALGSSGYQPIDITSETIATDTELRFYTVCKDYRTLHKQTETTKEFKRFKTSDLVTKQVQYVSASVGFDVTFPQVLAMYRACSYDTYFHDSLSPWCTLLGPETLEVLEFHDDLKQWWVKSYGHTLNYAIACPLMSSIVEEIEAVWKDYRSGNAHHLRARIRFGHAETLQPFISLLGLYRDEEGLFANATYDAILKRKYRASTIVPYAANVFFSLNECDGEPYVNMYVNEDLTPIPGCETTPSGDCPLTAFKDTFAEIVDKCDFDALCGTRLRKNARVDIPERLSGSDSNDKRGREGSVARNEL
ncbi:hypothetical protein SARC_08087 [Sphaeroforma arctica JP610]|uniref:Multiple inositol polyphosphate phosphatase 1 n=1 Tax=Sphaeroforma arctica JP610 TaxID=667725 RepID=A0A0L0FS33_9EUKA|nr:hypothetical protein SARC_08087 [Sphaeroforma arctica JP610]KNC79519.1 hypothetical protein SARC_08087 [Sphaeroforma arctica JP610]|eukprot:XP_014153421.1 hypothetical protein SARC_08087 [Sphaeroforma arctica JP610]